MNVVRCLDYRWKKGGSIWCLFSFYNIKILLFRVWHCWSKIRQSCGQQHDDSLITLIPATMKRHVFVGDKNMCIVASAFV